MSDNRELKWFVFVEDVNKKQIRVYNIFEHKDFMEDCNDAWKDYEINHRDFLKFKRDIDSVLMYYFWCKCEWEIILSNFPPSDSFQKKKIDVYQQVKINWNKFISQWERK